MNDMTFDLINNEGQTITCDILHTFEHNNKNYLIYTDNELDLDGNIEVLAAIYHVNDNKVTLEDIKTDEEWNLIDQEWSQVYNEK
jgi:uncharacterized protein YrzB (UPF0473 family)